MSRRRARRVKRSREERAKQREAEVSYENDYRNYLKVVAVNNWGSQRIKI